MRQKRVVVEKTKVKTKGLLEDLFLLLNLHHQLHLQHDHHLRRLVASNRLHQHQLPQLQGINVTVKLHQDIPLCLLL